MTIFEYLTVAVSIVLALGTGHLISGIPLRLVGMMEVIKYVSVDFANSL